MKRLYKSSSNKVVFGVLGGLGDFLNIDPIILRIIYVALAFGSTSNLFIVYLIASIIIPKDDGIIYDDNNPKKSKDNTVVLMGMGLIVLGSYLLLRRFLPTFNIMFIPRINAIFRQVFELWPILFIVLGIYMIFNQKK